MREGNSGQSSKLVPLDALTPREAQVIKMRFGLEEYGEHTLAAIGETLSLTRERVRQIEADALRKMREGVSAGGAVEVKAE